ncbi:MAG: dUTP diphosphatase [Candidatus Omnitrophica bacterium]|jgi:dUTP pyrophosphatase|nr:dUTP diphosphatase [Candidatus Omnitrophota bacterium]
MSEIKLQIVKMFDDVKLPSKQNPTDSGFDLYAYSFKKYYQNHGSNYERLFEDDKVTPFIRDGELELASLDRVLIGTGLKMTVGPGYELQVRARSGLALKQGLSLVNGIGTIDYSYRDECCVILINLSRKNQVIKLGDRIAQIVPMAVALPEIQVVQTLDGVDRGGGFGHTNNN